MSDQGYLFLFGLHNIHNNPFSCYKKSILLFFIFPKLYFYFSNSFKIIFLRLLDNSHITKQPSKINSSSKNCFYSKNNITKIKISSFFFFFNFLSSQTDHSNQNHTTKIQYTWAKVTNIELSLRSKHTATKSNTYKNQLK